MTEAQKVLHLPATASIYLYAFANATDTGFAQWEAIDLVRLRHVWADPFRGGKVSDGSRHVQERSGAVTETELPDQHGMCSPC